MGRKASPSKAGHRKRRRSSSSNRVPQPPNTKALKKKQKTYVPASLLYSVRNEDEEDDEHGSIQIDIDTLIDEVTAAIRATRNEIWSRMASDKLGKVVPCVPPNWLGTPPNSPGEITDSPSISPETKRAQEILRAIEWQRLIEIHRMLYDCRSDIGKLKTSWKANQMAYVKKVMMIREINDQIEVLELQLEATRKLNHEKEYLQHDVKMGQWQQEILTRIDIISDHKTWIFNNREVMQILFQNFLRLSKKVNELMNFGDEIEKMQGAFLYESSKDLRDHDWYQDPERGFHWWLEQAIADAKEYRAALETNAAGLGSDLLRYKEKIPSMQKLLVELDQHTLNYTAWLEKEFRRLRNTKSDIELAAVQAELLQSESMAASVQDDLEYEQTKRDIKAYQRKTKEKQILLKAGVHTQRKVDLFLEALRICKFSLDARHANTLQPSLQAMEESLYSIGDIIQRRQGLCFEFADILDSQLLSYKKREAILNGLNDHSDYFINLHRSRLQKLEVMGTWQTSIVIKDCLEAVAKLEKCWGEELFRFDINLQSWIAIAEQEDEPIRLNRYSSGSSGASSHGKESQGGTLKRLVSFKSKPKPKPRRYQFQLDHNKGPGMSLQLCRTLLLRKVETGLVETTTDQPAWVDQLTKTFTSPDIFHQIWRNKTKFKRRALYDWINTFVAKPIDDIMLDAFMKYCNHHGELFTTSTHKTDHEPISVATKGWELCAENPIQGLARKFKPDQQIKPDGIEEVEHWLREYARTARPWDSSHELDISARQWFIDSSKIRISKEMWWGYIAHWSLMGTFFVWADETQQYRLYGQEEVIRVDNGWDDKLFTREEPLKRIFGKSSTLQPPHPSIETDVLYKNIDGFDKLLRSKGEKLNGTNMFNYVFGTMSTRTEGLSWTCTRNQFYLYLRWSNDRPSKERKFLNGRVKPMDTFKGGPSWGKHSYER